MKENEAKITIVNILLKALYPIVVSVLGNSMFWSEEQPLKAFCPILLTPSVITIDCNEVQALKA